MKINNWIKELKNSKEKIERRKIKQKDELNIQKLRKKEENNKESKEDNKEPASKLIERRFAKVKD